MPGGYDVLGQVHSGGSVCVTIKCSNYCFSHGAVLCPNAFLISQESKFSLRQFLGENYDKQ